LEPQELTQRLTDFLKRSHGARSVRVDGLRLLTGGASRQTWSFDAVIDFGRGKTKTLPLVLRSDPRGGPNFMERELEYRLLKAAGDEGVPVPKVHLMGDDSLGLPFFLMERVEGETIPRRLLRDDIYAEARRSMTRQLATALAGIHRIAIERHGLSGEGGLSLPPEDKSPAETELSRFEQTYRAITPEAHPAFELAIRWLRKHEPPAAERGLVHGDYRIGNVIFGPEGTRAILDWELAHIGDPMEDLGWICVRSWRFGNDDLPVGGIGTREEFWRAYEAAGGSAVDPDRVRFWEVFGNLRWGIICVSQARTYLSGVGSGAAPAGGQVELASIGRRTSETEWELLNLMEVP
jgi:aminoglycoside phosphotransferase (APT) family kinase protein